MVVASIGRLARHRPSHGREKGHRLVARVGSRLILKRGLVGRWPRQFRDTFELRSDGRRRRSGGLSEEADPQARAELRILADCWRKVAADHERVERLESFLISYETTFATRWGR